MSTHHDSDASRGVLWSAWLFSLGRLESLARRVLRTPRVWQPTDTDARYLSGLCATPLVPAGISRLSGLETPSRAQSLGGATHPAAHLSLRGQFVSGAGHGDLSRVARSKSTSLQVCKYPSVPRGTLASGTQASGK